MLTHTDTSKTPQLPLREFFWLTALKHALSEIEAETGREDIGTEDLIDLVWAKINPPPIDAAFDWLAERYAEQMLAALDRATVPTPRC
jgi:hypothetical protein